MVHYLIELAIWILIAYFLGCLVGWIIRNIAGGRPAAEVAAAPAQVATASTAPQKPMGIAAARGGKADDLQRVSGIGPKNEAILHGLGIYHFDQIAAWTPAEIKWVDDHLKFNGRIQREEWVRQASLLAAGKEDIFARDYGTGGLKNEEGDAVSGTRTKR
jgi:predicted flap endonuclease-1-like 5' DNA nuclease